LAAWLECCAANCNGCLAGQAARRGAARARRRRWKRMVRRSGGEVGGLDSWAWCLGSGAYTLEGCRGSWVTCVVQTGHEPPLPSRPIKYLKVFSRKAPPARPAHCAAQSLDGRCPLVPLGLFVSYSGNNGLGLGRPSTLGQFRSSIYGTRQSRSPLVGRKRKVSPATSYGFTRLPSSLFSICIKTSIFLRTSGTYFF
jgi:hypothetical protein